MIHESKRRPARGGAETAAKNSNSDTKHNPPPAPRQGNSSKPRLALGRPQAAPPPGAIVNPLPNLVAELDLLLAGLWPGELRALIDPVSPRPLAIGISTEIAEAIGMGEDERQVLGRWFMSWTNTLRYLTAVRCGGPRFGLDGQPVEPVTEEHRQGAAQRIATRLARYRRKGAA
jgi:hypothetical protein